ncbi:hypothetical protein GCM10028791_42300 [Echinicola sediminis]
MNEKKQFRINGFEQINGFFDFIYDNRDKGITSHHVSLYLFYLAQNNIHMWVEWFSCPYQVAMQGACIGNKKTFYQKIEDLVEWGLIQYKKGVNEHRSPLIKLEVLNRTSSVPVVVPLLVPLPIPLPTPLRVRVNKLLTNNIQQITNNLDSFEDFIDSLNKENDEDGIVEANANGTTPQEEPVTFPDPEQETEREVKATQVIADYFGISEINQFSHYMAIGRFVRAISRNGKLNYLHTQYQFYKKVKEQNPTYKHSWKTFIGSPEKKYEDGAWNEQNWETKFKDSLKGNNDNPQRLSYSLNQGVSQTNYTPVIKRTKELLASSTTESEND